ncbi:protein TIC 20-II, chloroplastic-like [Nicotiana tabacum]|uniref:Protein TIC 20 n=1 Tax=Nicotiana tabacum TaxID=4097 RepID=A0A1S4A4R1_TOBAC|nr:protein TIC 20-II, chloroplastic [Nicotiana tomentosiformis]XP_016471556.1 PREDICTED: protein TIC 20-II, chloroplastic-like [Nicotiana tabacum]
MASIPLLRFTLPKTLKPKTPLTPHHLLLPHPLKPTIPKLLQAQKAQTQTKPNSISATYNPIPATDRLISAVAYFLPFFNGLQYGRFLFSQYPSLTLPFQPILPLLSLYRSIPYASFVTFFALYLGIVRNESLNRYARFNALQAVVLDVLLVVPMLIQRIFSPGQSGIGLKLTMMMHNGLFVFVVGCFVYGLVSCILGKTPYLPFVTEAANRQM